MINIQNIDDNECFKWCLLRYLNPANHNPRKITKADKDFAKRLGFEDIKFLVKIRDVHKMEEGIVEENIFVVIVYTLSLQKKF